MALEALRKAWSGGGISHVIGGRVYVWHDHLGANAWRIDMPNAHG